MIQAMTIWGQDRYILLDSKDNGPDQCISSLICLMIAFNCSVSMTKTEISWNDLMSLYLFNSILFKLMDYIL